MAESIRNIMATAYLNVLGNPREARFVAKMQRTIGRAERRRKAYLEKEGVAVPPFLIASIATTCNLQCKGCYARKNGIAGDTPTKETLSPEQWGTIFQEAAELGISFCLLVMDGNLVDYDRADLDAANAAEREINLCRDRLRNEHLEALKHGRYGYEVGNAYSSLYAQYEKLADFVINVTEAVTGGKR